jgi:hypothetical protein
MSTQRGIINGHGDFLKTLVLVELAKRLYSDTPINPQICCVCINTSIIPHQVSILLI